MNRSFVSVLCISLLMLWAALLLQVQPVVAQNAATYTARQIGDTIRNGEVLTVRDTSLSAALPNIDSVWNSKCVIGLFIEEGTEGMLRRSFVAKMKIRIELQQLDGSWTSAVLDSLLVNYDSASNYIARDYRVFENALGCKVTVDTLEIVNGFADVKKLLTAYIDIGSSKTQLWASCSGVLLEWNSVYQANMENMQIDQLPVSWKAIDRSIASEFDLEWAWVDSSALAVRTSGGDDKAFVNNASRVTIESNSYNIPIIYDGAGVLFYRVRPVQVSPSGIRTEGLWNAPQKVGLRGFQRDLNWQSNTSFAEEGKRKTVLSYFDGSLRNRQTVTLDNSSGKAIVAETLYDYQGRPAIQVLPAPTMSDLLAFKNDFTKVAGSHAIYDRTVFDTLVNGQMICNMAAPAMSDSSGAARYYSPLNDEVATIGQEISRFIPNAAGFPFTQTRYALDNTGRIAAQSGVGPDHRLGGHDTRYYYGKPTDEELAYLFGTEVGNAQHYQKNMVRDANGQYSVSYVDMQGRTIATAMAGTSPKEVIGNSQQLLVRDLSNQGQYTIKEDLLRNTAQLVDANAIISNNGMVVPVRGNYRFDYELGAQVLKMLDCRPDTVCYDCLYDFNFSIVDDCGKIVLDTTIEKVSADTTKGWAGIDGLANTGSFTFFVERELEEGSYQIVKTLTLRSDSRDLYRDSVFGVANTCRSFEDFVKEAIAEVKTQLRCTYQSCNECLAAIGTLDAFRNQYVSDMGITDSVAARPEILAAFAKAQTNCESFCEDAVSRPISIRQQMLDDMMPPTGQYAEILENGALPSNIYSIFNFGNSVPYRTITNYTDANGYPALATNSNGQSVPPQELSVLDFQNEFESTWANSLITLHPEKARLDALMPMLPSYRLSEQMLLATGFREAEQRGWTGTSLVDLIDPATATASTLPVRTAIINKLQNPGYFPATAGIATPSIWQVAGAMVRCDKPDAAANCVSAYLSQPSASVWNKLDTTNLCDPEKDKLWSLFASMYTTIKDSVIMAYVRNIAAGAGMGESRFVSEDPVQNNDLPNLYQSGGSTLEVQMKAALQQQIDSSCASYVDLWLQELGGCNYTAGEWATLRQRLIGVCGRGGDINQVLGGSVALPAKRSANEWENSFVAAVKKYNDEIGKPTDAGCNGLLIAHIPGAVAPATDVVYDGGQPDSCTCARLTQLQAEWQASGNRQGDANLASWLQRTYKTTLTHQQVSLLQAACAKGASANCDTLAGESFFIPPIISNCAATPPCIDCTTLESWHRKFMDSSGFTLPALPATDPAGLQVLRSYAAYMNYKAGFNYDADVYLNFLANCPNGGALLRADSLRQRLDSIKSTYTGAANASNCRIQFAAHYNAATQQNLTYTQIDSLYFVTTGLYLNVCRPITLADTCQLLNQITINYQNYISKNRQAIPVRMRTLLGNYTPDEGPKGVFDINGNLIDTTVAGPTLLAIKQSFVNIWNSSSTNQAAGTLGLDANGQMWFALKPGASFPCRGIIGMRYYSFTLSSSVLQNIHTGIGSYVDFGNGVRQPISLAPSGNPQVTQASQTNATGAIQIPAANYGALRVRYVYTSAGQRTVRIFHSDTLGIVGAEPSGVSPANGNITTFANLRGYFPQHLLAYYTNGTQQASYNSTQQIANFSSINSIRVFGYSQGNSGADMTVTLNLDFGTITPNNKLQQIILDRTGKPATYLQSLLGNIDAHFPAVEVISLRLNANEYNPQFRFRLPYLKTASFFIDGGLPVSTIDSIISDISSTTTQCGGTLHFYFYGINVTHSASVLPQIQALVNKGWTIRIDQNNTVNISLYQPADTVSCPVTNPATPPVIANNAYYYTPFSDYVNQSGVLQFATDSLLRQQLNRCGNSFNQCEVGTKLSSCDSLQLIADNFKNSYNRPYKFVADAGGCNIASWVSNWGQGKLPSASLAQQLQNGLFVPLATTAPSYAYKYAAIDYYDTVCFRPFTFEARLQMPKTGDVWNPWYSDSRQTNLFTFENYFYFDVAGQNATGRHFDYVIEGLRGEAANRSAYIDRLGQGDVVSSFVPVPSLDNWVNYKIQITSDSSILSINGQRIFANWHPPFTNFNGFYFTPYSAQFRLDWVRLTDSSGRVWMNEEFDKACSGMSQITINPCYDNCSTAFASYYNQQRGTSYSPAQVDSIYATRCQLSPQPCALPVQPKLCGRAEALMPQFVVQQASPCADTLQLAMHLATERYRRYTDSLRGAFDSAYTARCMQAQQYEKLTLRRPVSEYHYTLYYYDQAGNLVKTVPPQGVQALHDSVRNLVGGGGAAGSYAGRALDSLAQRALRARALGQAYLLPYRMATHYRYNSLNQVVAQLTPDAGLSRFWYDTLGRLAISQNARQQPLQAYSYTLYDWLGRIAEVGQKTQPAFMSSGVSRSPLALLAWMNHQPTQYPRTQITRTGYDLPAAPTTNRLQQRYLRGRVSYSLVQATDAASLSSIVRSGQPPAGNAYSTATYYSYDVHGNVTHLLQHYAQGPLYSADPGKLNQYKLVAYQYDLISGKVNEVQYQPGYYETGLNKWVTPPDRYYQRYRYDAENRLTRAEFSRDSVYWEEDARYRYYRHGPLARTELGQIRVQGLDYAYTLQGWLKGVNSSHLTHNSINYDMGQDAATGTNRMVATDAIGFSLHYYHTDYASISTGMPRPFIRINVNDAPGHADFYMPLYNGNISAMSTNVAVLPAPVVSERKGTNAFVRTFRYDQLNRLRNVNTYTEFSDAGTMVWNIRAWAHEEFTYDANGNIQTASRRGMTSPTAHAVMDNLTYQYQPGTNRLLRVGDAVAAGTFSTDIDNQPVNNYAYDAIGNLVKDSAEGISRIAWNVYGKIDSIYKSGQTIAYRYDAGGNRIGKQVSTSGSTVSTWYVRDAQGNVLSTYTHGSGPNTQEVYQDEVHLYGSSRLGTHRVALATLAAYNSTEPSVTVGTFKGLKRSFTRGNKFFELSNHLGNVLAVVSDRKVPVASANPALVARYTPVVVQAQDYYAFGMLMPQRSYNASAYKYGFNGKEMDYEVSGNGNQYDYGFRIYNPRLGRFLSTDPLFKSYPWYTPYQFAGNKPIWAVDLDGLEEFTSTFFKVIFGSPASYDKPKTALDYLNKERFIAQKNFAESRTGRFLGGATNFTFGTIGAAGSIAYIGATDGAGAALGGSIALQFSLGEMAIGVTQMLDAFSSKNMTPFIHEAGSLPGLIAYGAGSKYAPFFDALGQFTPTLATAGSFKGLVKSGLGVIDAARTFNNTPSIVNALATLDQVSDAKGFVLESFNLLSKTENNKLTQSLVYSFSYTIQKGETLTSIAKKFGTTIENISKQNNITNPDEVNEGQKIKFKGFANGSMGGAGAGGKF